jgi:phytoene dehydrogenase-like protein
VKQKHDVIVVGGGIAGLVATVYLAREGLDVLLLERNERCGGLVNTFVRDGFRFEGGVRALISAGIIFPMLDELGITLDPLPNRVSVGIEDRITHVNSPESLREYLALLKCLYPESETEIERVGALVSRVMREMSVLYKVSNPAFHDFRGDKRYFVGTFLPWFFRFLLTLVNIATMRGPVEPYLDRIVKQRALRDIISQHFFRGTPTFFAMSYFYLYNDYLYPKGGVGKLTEALEQKIHEFGGNINTGAEVASVHAGEKWVKDREGRQYEYEELVWAADLKTLYRITETEGCSPLVVNAFETKKQQLLAGRGTDSVFTVYVGVDEPPETFAAISHGHFFYTPSRLGLGEIHRSELRAMLRNWDAYSRAEVLAWLDRFCERNTYEISIPVLKDPTAAPPHKTGLIVSTLFEYELVKKVKESGWYEDFKTEVERQMLNVLSASIYPMLRDRVLFAFSASPLTLEAMVGSSEGAIVGWSFEEPIPVTSQMLKISDAVKTALPHVSQAGQWTYSPNGVPTCILTGKLAADRVIAQRKHRSGR